MKPFLTALHTLRRRTSLVLAAAMLLASAMQSSLCAADVIWNNGSGSFLWNTERPELVDRRLE